MQHCTAAFSENKLLCQVEQGHSEKLLLTNLQHLGVCPQLILNSMFLVNMRWLQQGTFFYITRKNNPAIKEKQINSHELKWIRFICKSNDFIFTSMFSLIISIFQSDFSCYFSVSNIIVSHRNTIKYSADTYLTASNYWNYLSRLLKDFLKRKTGLKYDFFLNFKVKKIAKRKFREFCQHHQNKNSTKWIIW